MIAVIFTIPPRLRQAIVASKKSLLCFWGQHLKLSALSRYELCAAAQPGDYLTIN